MEVIKAKEDEDTMRVLAFLTQYLFRNGSDDEPAPAVAAVPVEEPQAEEVKPSKRGKKASKPDAVSSAYRAPSSA
jgi:hypothetical protein